MASPTFTKCDSIRGAIHTSFQVADSMANSKCALTRILIPGVAPCVVRGPLSSLNYSHMKYAIRIFDAGHIRRSVLYTV